MNSMEQFQNHLNQQREATLASASDLAKHLQAIAAAHTDYAKRKAPHFLKNWQVPNRLKKR